MKMIKRIVLLFLALYVPNIKFVKAQDIYVFHKRFDPITQSLLFKNGFKPIEILTVGNIDPKRNNSVDINKVKSFLEGTFNSIDSYTLVIDWEEKGYRDLRHKDPTSEDFIDAEGEYIKLIKLIKKYNPNIQVGIYGIPFRLSIGKNANLNTKKYDSLLSNVDFIAPSVYSMSPVQEVGQKVNRKFFQQNVRQALSYGVRLNKPVLPFVWELVHPDNQTYGGILLGDNEFFSNVDFLLNYEFLDSKIAGVIWWSPSVISSEYEKGLKEKLPKDSFNTDPRSIYFRSRIGIIHSRF